MEKSIGGYEFKSEEVRLQNAYIKKIAFNPDVECIRIILKETMQVREYYKHHYKNVINYLYKEGRKLNSIVIIEPVFSQYYRGNTEIEF